MSENQVTRLTASVGRHDEGAPCPRCDGYADRSYDVTEDEEQLLGCGRPGCCSRVFVCRRCGERLLASAESPEMD